MKQYPLFYFWCNFNQAVQQSIAEQLIF